MGKIKKFNKGHYHLCKITKTNASTPEYNPGTSKNNNVDCTPSSASRNQRYGHTVHILSRV